MPSYKAPVDDVMFLLSDVFHIDRYNNLPGFADATPDLIEAVLAEAAKFCRGGAHPAQPRRRQGRLPPPRRRLGHDADRIQGRLSEAHRRRLDRTVRRPPNSAARACRWCWRRPSTNFSARRIWRSRMYPGLTQGAIAALLAHASPEQKALYLPKLVAGAMGRHHEPDRAAMRHRSRSGAHARRAAARRQLQNHRHQDFHLRRRARSRREHRSSGAGAHRRRAGRHARAFRCSSCRNFCRRPTAGSARAMPCRAARSKRRWASTATPPA